MGSPRRATAAAALSAPVFALLLGGLLWGASALPRPGDPGSPASTRVSPRYIERAAEETGALNMVTAVLADYRSFDTLGETLVIFAAGLGCLVVLAAFGGRPERAADAPGADLSFRFGTGILDAAARLLAPGILVFSVYVLIHGHTSPGGGFQGGVLFGSGLVAVRLVRGSRDETGAPTGAPSLRSSLVMACAGILGYVGIGLAAMAFGGAFLDFGHLPLSADTAHARELATLGIETAVFFTVAGTVGVLYDAIAAGLRG